MPDRPHTTLQEKLNQRLRFYEDLGLGPFYRDRGGTSQRIAPSVPELSETLSAAIEESTLRKSAPKIMPSLKTIVPESAAKLPVLPTATGPSLFEASDKILGDTLLKTREDLGECTRCKLHKTRHKIVFGDGSPKADLVFIVEGPGADEDAQGLPFVGRAGKLLTQMIEAMGLQRRDVYICNVVKCRPPENRQPEKDEVMACSPFSRRMAGFPRIQNAGHLPSRVFAAQSGGEGRSLERSSESHGRARPRSQKKGEISAHGHSARRGHSVCVGKRGFSGALCNSCGWKSARRAGHAGLRRGVCHDASSIYARLGPPV